VRHDAGAFAELLLQQRAHLLVGDRSRYTAMRSAEL
jgi:hypothetical protein